MTVWHEVKRNGMPAFRIAVVGRCGATRPQSRTAAVSRARSVEMKRSAISAERLPMIRRTKYDEYRLLCVVQKILLRTILIGRLHL